MNRKQALVIVATGLIFGLIMTVYGAVEIATVTLGFNIQENLEVTGYLDGVLVEGQMTVDFDTAMADTTYNMALDFFNSGNVDATVSVTVTAKPSAEWVVTFNNNEATVSFGNWLNGTLSVYVPTVAAGYYTVAFTVNVDKAGAV